MIKMLKELIRAQYGWQSKVRVCEIFLQGIASNPASKEHRFIRRVVDMYLSQ